MSKKSRTVVPDFSRSKPTKGAPVTSQSANTDANAKKPANVKRAVPSAPSGKGGHRGS